MKNKKGIILILTCLLFFALGVISLYTPKAVSEKGNEFSALSAKEHIKEIAKEPHSILDVEALKEVREYILSELKALGLSPEVFTYENIQDKYGNVVDLNNIYAKIDGKKGEDGKYILLATHYDSSPKKRAGEEAGSLGAADAGYGISTILEILRVIKENNLVLENGIKILITDGEEMGLLGAKEEMNNNFSLYENVAYVVNLEARGVKGPALMFETSSNNKKVIDLYKEANLPVSYSLAADVYSKMPNGSDFTEFKNKGLQGINFAVLNSLDYYHTPRDSYENVSDTSVQHYGSQVYPIVHEFLTNEKYGEDNYFDSKESSVFFTLLPNVFINYSTTISLVFLAIAVILIVIAIRALNIRIKELLKAFGIFLGFGLSFAIIGFIASYIISLISGVAFKLTYMPKVPFAGLITIILSVILLSLLYIAIKKLAKTTEKATTLIFGGIIFNLLLLIVFHLALPGGTYLFLWPIIVSSLSLLAYKRFNNKLSLLAPVGFSILLFVPVIYNIYIALTIGALAVIFLLLFIAISIIVPFTVLFMNK